MPIFFTPPENIKENENKILILGEEAKHIIKSLRYKIKDRILVSDGKKNKYLTIIEEYKNNTLSCRIIKPIRENKKENQCEIIVLAQSILKGDKMDWLIQKTTELGINTILPFVSTRTIPLLTFTNYEKRKKRWQKIAYEASKQSLRSIIPEIRPMVHYNDLLNHHCNLYDLSLIFWEKEKTVTLKDIVNSSPTPRKILYLIGPEGGFSEEEINSAKNYGLKTVSLGNNCLRSETAALFVLSILKFFYHFTSE